MGLSEKYKAAGFFVGAAATAFLLQVASAYAQDTAGSSAAPTESQKPLNELSEVIVTAERRSERLQDVPLSVTALTPEALAAAAITSTEDLPLITPGLRMDSGGIYTQPVIRGITTYQTFVSSDANVATYIDGVYQQAMLGAIYELPDVQQIEVLKGPQGTLFGRNATGGAILINTLDPNLSTTTGNFSAAIGNLLTYYGKGYFSTPLVQDKLAASATVYYDHTDGYMVNLLDDKRYSPVNNLVLRGKLRFDPWEGGDFVLSASYSKRLDYQDLRNNFYDGNNLYRAKIPASQLAVQPDTFAQYYNSHFADYKSDVSLRGIIDLGPGQLKSTSAYTRTSTQLTLDCAGVPLDLCVTYFPVATTQTYSEDLVYTTNQLGKFHATVGADVYNNRGVNLPLLYVVPPISLSDNIWTEDTSMAYAGFGELTYDLTDQLSLTAGLRYSSEKKAAYYANTLAFTINTILPEPPIPLLGEHTWTATTPRGSLLYKVTDRTNLYFTYSQGFQSGAFNTVAAQTTPVAPEEIKSYEAGIKSSVTDNVTVNAAFFYYDYTDLQVATIYNLPNGTYTQVITNAANAKIYGSELNANWHATPEFSVALGGTYLHARYADFTTASLDVPIYANGLPTGNTNIKANASGNTMIGSPTLTADLTPRYIKTTSVGTFDFSSTLYYSTRVFYDVGDRIVQPGYVNLNATMMWQPVGSKWQFGLWGKNLTDKLTIVATTIDSTGDSVQYSAPRTYGVRAKYAF
jgi:iron complex outermembrane receptor protein